MYRFKPIVVIGMAFILSFSSAGCLNTTRSTDPSSYVPHNMIDNYDFSQGVDESGIPIGWTLLGKLSGDPVMSVEVSNNQSSVGDYSVRIEDRVGSGNDAYVGLISEYFDVEPGWEFRLEADIYVESGAPYLEIEFRKEGRGSSGKTSTFSLPDPDVMNDWQRVVLDAVVPDEMAHFKVHLYSTTKNTGVAYFDNVLLYRMK